MKLASTQRIISISEIQHTTYGKDKDIRWIQRYNSFHQKDIVDK